MTSLLNVSNDACNKPEEFNLKDIEVLVDSEEQNWFQRDHVRKFLNLRHTYTSAEGLNKCEIVTRQELVPTSRTTGGWSGPKDHQNQTD